jgi:phosphate transport system protein
MLPADPVGEIPLMTNEHTLKSFDQSLALLRTLVTSLGAQVNDQLGFAMTALLKGNRALAEIVIEKDARADAVEQELHGEVVLLIARYQAMACDLREIIAAARIASNLERIGDHAKSIAKRSITLGEAPPASLADMLTRYSDEVRSAVRMVLDAYQQRDAEKAHQVWLADATLDEHYDDCFHRVLSAMQDGRESVLIGTHVLFVAKSLERIGDHATNIAEDIRFMITGQAMQRRVTMPSTLGS